MHTTPTVAYSYFASKIAGPFDFAINLATTWTTQTGHRHRLTYLGDGMWRCVCLRSTCPHGNTTEPRPCGCKLIDGAWHPCAGCPTSCGNCL